MTNNYFVENGSKTWSQDSASKVNMKNMCNESQPSVIMYRHRMGKFHRDRSCKSKENRAAPGSGPLSASLRKLFFTVDRSQ